MIDFTKLKGRRVYQFVLDEETGEITDITSRDDYVRVVRCKDCVHYLAGQYCLNIDDYSKPTDFCSWAERKEE